MDDDSLIKIKKDLYSWLLLIVIWAIAVHAAYIISIGIPNTFLSGNAPIVRTVLTLLGFHFGVAAMVMTLGKLLPKPNAWSIVLWGGVGIGGYGYVFFVEHSAAGDATSNALIFLSGLGLHRLFCLLQAVVGKIIQHKTIRIEYIIYIQLCLLVTLLGMVTGLGLELTKYLFPATFDYHLYRIDVAYAGLAVWCGQTFEHAWPVIKAATLTSYTILVLSFYVVLGLLLRERRMNLLNGWRTFIVPFMLAFFCYAWMPVSGPNYAFFGDRFPFDLPLPAEVASAKVVIPPFARNGMPSFHLTGAILVWMLAAGLQRKVAFGFASILVLMTLWSTMALGEHYAIDLIVAMPFALSLGWTLINPGGMANFASNSGRWVAVGWLTFFAWMVMLVTIPGWLSLHLTYVRIFSVWSVLVALGLAAIYIRHVWRYAPNELASASHAESPSIDESNPQVPRAPTWVLAIFFASGFAGLVYEVVFAKALALTFGSTSLAAYTVLTVYMGGMALGSWLGGLLADRTNRPLTLYAIFEAIIGIYALFTPVAFKAIQNLYVYLGTDAPPDAGWLTVLRVGLGALALVLPTLLMGATLPLMFKFLNTQGLKRRAAIANLYSANVLGAAFGSLVAGYVILPALGRNGSTFVAAMLSLLIALYSMDRAKKHRLTGLMNLGNAPDHPPVGEKIGNSSDAKFSKVFGISALIVLGVGGAVTLALEVVSMHLLSTIAGSSVYAFGLMLGAFLFGLGVGSSVGERVLGRVSHPYTILIAQSGLALSIALTAHLWDSLPGYFGSFGMTPVYLGFGGREMIRAMVCMIAMVPGAFFIGLSYPAAMALASEWLAPINPAKGIGGASCINTIGNISGVLIVGFFVLPWLGSRVTLLVLAVTALCLVVLFAMLTTLHAEQGQKAVRNVGIAFASLAIIGVLGFPRAWDWNELSSGSNVYFLPQKWGNVIEHSESVEGGITAVTRNEGGILTLLTNGKFQGNNSQGGEMQAQASFALLPLLHLEARERALVIGYGTGMTAQVLHEQNFKSIDIAELSSDLVGLANKHFASINHAVTSAPSVRLHITDGRNFLLTQSDKYDLVSIELTSIWFAGAANLYNRDFYELVKSRLNEGGVLQQWVQLHHMNPIDLVYILGSIRSEFDHVWVYYSGGQGVIIASNSAKYSDNEGAVRLLSQSSSKHFEIPSVSSLASRLVASPENVDALIRKYDPTFRKLVSTDDNLYLEYATPKGNAVKVDTVPENLNLLRQSRETK